MSHAAIQEKPAPLPPSGGRDSLSARSLPRWSQAGFAVAGIVVGVAIGAGSGLTSKVQWGLIAVVAFLVLSYVITAMVENKRQAKDRLATSIVWVVLHPRRHPAVLAAVHDDQPRREDAATRTS